MPKVTSSITIQTFVLGNTLIQVERGRVGCVKGDAKDKERQKSIRGGLR